MTDEALSQIFTLEGLLAKTPDAFKPIVVEYAPALITMTAEEFWAWVKLLVMGRESAAWQELLARMPNAELLAEWKKKAGQWADAVDKNAERVSLQKEAILATLKVLLVAAFSMVGL